MYILAFISVCFQFTYPSRYPVTGYCSHSETKEMPTLLKQSPKL